MVGWQAKWGTHTRHVAVGLVLTPRAWLAALPEVARHEHHAVTRTRMAGRALILEAPGFPNSSLRYVDSAWVLRDSRSRLKQACPH